MKKLSYWNILYVLAVLACGMGTVSVAGEQGFSLSLVAMVAVSYVCQMVFYGKSQVNYQQKLGYTDMFYTLCLFFVVPALVIFLSSHPLYALLGLVLFAGLMFTNPKIHQWWSSLPAE